MGFVQVDGALFGFAVLDVDLDGKNRKRFDVVWVGGAELCFLTLAVEHNFLVPGASTLLALLHGFVSNRRRLFLFLCRYNRWVGFAKCRFLALLPGLG